MRIHGQNGAHESSSPVVECVQKYSATSPNCEKYERWEFYRGSTSQQKTVSSIKFYSTESVPTEKKIRIYKTTLNIRLAIISEEDHIYFRLQKIGGGGEKRLIIISWLLIALAIHRQISWCKDVQVDDINHLEIFLSCFKRSFFFFQQT